MGALTDLEQAGRPAPATSVPVPGLPGPAQRISPEQRPLIIAVVLGYYLIPAALVYLGLIANILPGGPPSDGLTSVWQWLVGVPVLVLLFYTGVQGEVRSGPGWIATRRAVRWQVVTAQTAASVDVRPDQTYGFVLRFKARAGRQHVDLTPPGLSKRPGQLAAAYALAEVAGRRGAEIDPSVGVVFEGLGFPSLGQSTTSPADVHSRMSGLHRAHKRRAWVVRLVVTLGSILFFVQVGAMAVVALVRLLGFHS